ncbi:c-type cytochrome [Pararhizobium haloflavum]|uniref:c-type cytochrome n=1 Tax=Pararhizobium haloflavum TaxID=2037914 RepID=UPI000C179ECE|nr:cytochrome c [Pararhizobium haloflavum]
MLVAPRIIACLAIVLYGGLEARADPEVGRALATQYCSGCHAIAERGTSPHPQAPTFRSLSERYPIDALEETFIDRIDTGHAAMPVFDASPHQIADILDYIATVMEEE